MPQLLRIPARIAARREEVRAAVGNCPRGRRPAWRRAAAAALLCVLVATGYGDIICAGWTGSRAAREDCCTRMEKACDTVSVDACCASREQRTTSEMLPVTAAPAQAPVAVPFAFAAIGSSLHPNVSIRPPDDRPPAYLLNSILLI